MKLLNRSTKTKTKPIVFYFFCLILQLKNNFLKTKNKNKKKHKKNNKTGGIKNSRSRNEFQRSLTIKTQTRLKLFTTNLQF